MGGGGAYETDEGSDVGPAVLHEGVWPVANHVRDVVVETVRTWGGGGGGGVGHGWRRGRDGEGVVGKEKREKGEEGGGASGL